MGRDREDRVRGDDLLAEAVELAFPRYPGTAGDARMIELLSERLATAGCEVRRQAFTYDLAPVWGLLRALLAGGAMAVALAAWWIDEHPVAAITLLFAALAGGGSLLGWLPWLERLYRRPGPTRTENVEGRVPQEGGPIVILMAHHDSKSQNLTMLVRGLLTVVALVSLAALVLGGALIAAGALAGLSDLARGVLGGAGAASLALLATLTSGNESPGGVDNAGSLAILLAMARRLPRRVGAAAELRFLSTGAEEDHMIGAMRYLDQQFPDGPGERPVYVINLDGAGAPGRVVLLERYGFGRWFSRRLSELARAEAERLGLDPRGVLMPPAMGIDAIPVAHRDLPCLTLSSGSLGRATLAVHSAADRAENLDEATLEAVYRLATAMVERLAGREPKEITREPLRPAS